MATEIRIPKAAKDLRIKHLKAITESVLSEQPTIEEMLIFIHDLTGAQRYEIKKLHPSDVFKLYTIALSTFSKFKISDAPPKEITLQDRTLSLVDPRKVSTGWHIDMSNTDGAKDPVKLACLYYFPKGELYGATDENGGLINPIADRYELIKSELPLNVFIECNAFFLKKYEQSLMQQVARAKGKVLGMKLNRFLRGGSGKKQSTS